MKKNQLSKISILIKRDLFFWGTQPVVYIINFTVLFLINYYFFEYRKFFILDGKSVSLRYFFTFFANTLILYFPFFTSIIWKNENENTFSLPIKAQNLLLSKWIGQLLIYFLLLLFTLPSVIITSLFSNISLSETICTYFGLILYGALLSSITIFLSILIHNTILYISITTIILSILNCYYFFREFINLTSFLGKFLWEISLIGRLESFLKGIISFKDSFFYLIFSILFIELTIYIKKEVRKHNKKYIFLYSAIFLLCLINIYIYNLKFDVSENRLFTVSNTAKENLEKINSNLNITYYISPKLSDIYPQINDIKDYLFDYSSSNKNISLYFKNPEHINKETLLQLGVKSQQIETIDNNQVSYLDVYSTILLEYNDEYKQIPFTISLSTLEYDLSIRLKSLLTQKNTMINLLIGNNFSIENEYKYVIPWLESSGFKINLVSKENIQSLILSDIKSLIILGSSELSANEATYIEQFIINGGNILFAVSPNSADISTTWHVSLENNDHVLRMLDYWGINIGKSLILDENCYQIRMINSTENTRYKYIRYPFWITTNFQNYSKTNSIVPLVSDMVFYWASPINLSVTNSNYKVEKLITSSDNAWLEKPIVKNNNSYLTDPFLYQIEQLERKDKSQFTMAVYVQGNLPGYYVGGNSNESRLIIISDPYLPSVMIENTNSFGNLEFLTSSLLWISKNEDMLSIRNKQTKLPYVCKIQDTEKINIYKLKSELVLFIFIPCFIFLIALIFYLIRYSKGKKYEKRFL